MADGAVHIPNATPFAIITDSINDALVAVSYTHLTLPTKA